MIAQDLIEQLLRLRDERDALIRGRIQNQQRLKRLDQLISAESPFVTPARASVVAEAAERERAEIEIIIRRDEERRTEISDLFDRIDSII
jgi:hypothetical protein